LTIIPSSSSASCKTISCRSWRTYAYTADLANIFYVRQKETKGLGHAIWRAKRFVGNEPFAVLLGDDIMMADTPVTKQLVDAAEKYGASALGTQTVADEAISKYSSLKVSPLEERISASPT
jgi:UTP--glucose-1-phosphate uridylyltransferase